jgi:hypothetical protein
MTIKVETIFEMRQILDILVNDLENIYAIKDSINPNSFKKYYTILFNVFEIEINNEAIIPFFLDKEKLKILNKRLAEIQPQILKTPEEVEKYNKSIMIQI